MMEGIVTLLHGEQQAQIERLWRDLDADFGTGWQSHPHFSYQIAPHYPPARVQAVLAELSAETAPFTVQTSGFGLFPGKGITLYITVARTERLSMLQLAVWHRLRDAIDIAADMVGYYHPDRWIPHITLGHFHNARLLADALTRIDLNAFGWTVPVDNLSLLTDSIDENGLKYTFPLRG
jgi:2'-5' RNA ligase